MKKYSNSDLVYSINVEDLQLIAEEQLDRNLTNEEVGEVDKILGDYIGWYNAIESAIRKIIPD